MSEILEKLPDWVPVVGLVVLVALLVCAALLLSYAARAWGRRTARTTRLATVNTDPEQAADKAADRRKERWLFTFALLAAGVVYAALVVGSFKNLMHWADDVLKWQDTWQQLIVPISLDGFGTAAGIMAFRAIKRNRSAFFCYAMVWAATGTSAGINGHAGSEHGGTAAVYMGFLSFGVVAMFHLFIDQFQAGAGTKVHKYPPFGIRWVTKAWGKDCTILLFIDWVNSPPPPNIKPTVGNAIAHRRIVLANREQAKRDEAKRLREQVAGDEKHEAQLAREVEDAKNADTIAELQRRGAETLELLTQERTAREVERREWANERQADGAKVSEELAALRSETQQNAAALEAERRQREADRQQWEAERVGLESRLAAALVEAASRPTDPPKQTTKKAPAKSTGRAVSRPTATPPSRATGPTVEEATEFALANISPKGERPGAGRYAEHFGVGTDKARKLRDAVEEHLAAEPARLQVVGGAR